MDKTGPAWPKISALILFIALTITWSLYLASPPAPEPETIAEEKFSAERAFKHIKQIASNPHPIGSAENDRVRAYLLAELRKLGLHPRVEDGIGFNSWVVSGHTKNIIATMQGTDPTQTLLVMAHYDSQFFTPGAADDASGVAAILEMIRALQHRPALKNNLVILFTDGEEMGLLGARQFARSYPDIGEIDLVLNVEARGSSGVVSMFETGSGNAKLIKMFANASPNPFANSLTYTVYRMLPNDTDYTVLKEIGIQGLNFAFYSDYLNYHTMQDTPGNLSLASLQHHGEYLLHNLLLFGNQQLDLESDHDLAYFNNPWGGLFYYPVSWSYFLAGICLLLFLLLFLLQYRRGSISLPGILSSALLFIGVMLIVAAITHFGWQAVREIFSHYRWQQHGETYARAWYLWGFTGLTVLLFSKFFIWIKDKVNTSNTLGGIYLVLILLTILITIYLPAGSYLLIWPVGFGLLHWWRANRELANQERSWPAIGMISAGIFPVLFMFPPYIKFFHIVLTTNLLAPSLLLVTVTLGISWPAIRYLVDRLGRYWYLFWGLFTVVCIAGIILKSGYSPAQKKQNSLLYALDVDQDRAWWLSHDHRPDPWTLRYLGENPPDSSFSAFGLFGNRRLLNRRAPLIPLHPPAMEVLRDSTDDSLRYLSLRFSAPSGGNTMRVSLSQPDRVQMVAVSSVSIFDLRHPPENQPDLFSRLYHYADLSHPFTVDLILSGPKAPLQLKTVVFSRELPAEHINQFTPRPPHTMPKPFGFTNGTVLKKTYTVDPADPR
ncbi:MAG: M20/M25/M40 family metallo-hydrolase [Balneolaceae bacterium]|nr:M20/M25/M40 family metallo-hydrolase [Balneolaceae bacterium]